VYSPEDESAIACQVFRGEWRYNARLSEYCRAGVQMANSSTSAKRGLLLAFLAGMAVIHAALFWQNREKLHAGYQDFTIFYTAGKMLGRGDGARLYDDALQYRTQQEFASKVKIRDGPLPYNHIPIEGAIFVPLAKLAYFPAYVLWDLCSFMALTGALGTLRRRVPAFRDTPLLLWVVMGVAFFPTFVVLLQGQDNLLLLWLFALAYSAMHEGANFSAGCWLGLGLFRFNLTLPLLALLGLRKGRRMVAGFATAVAATTLASVALVGWEQMVRYPQYVLSGERTRTGYIVSGLMPNLRGLVETIVAGGNSTRLSVGTTALLSVVLLWLYFRRSQTSDANQQFDMRVSLAIVTAALVSYHAYLHDLSVLLIPVVLVLNYCQLRPEAWKRWALVAPMGILFVSPIYIALWFRMKLSCLLSVVLLIWFFGIARELSRHARSGIVGASCGSVEQSEVSP